MIIPWGSSYFLPNMGGSFRPVLANITMTKYEVIVDKLIEYDIIKFYIRYVDDTLPVIKRTDISYILN